MITGVRMTPIGYLIRLSEPVKNPCLFSPCRRYRYTLTHHMRVRAPWKATPERAMWIGLNPSTADENQLDPICQAHRPL